MFKKHLYLILLGSGLIFSSYAAYLLVDSSKEYESKNINSNENDDSLIIVKGCILGKPNRTGLPTYFPPINKNNGFPKLKANTSKDKHEDEFELTEEEWERDLAEDSEKDYESKKPVNSSDFEVISKEGKFKYLLSRPHKELDFSIDFELSEEDLEAVSKDSVNVLLFDKPAWSSQELNEDKYRSLSKRQFEYLFRNRDESKVKQILLSLSSRRHWIKLSDERYYSVSGGLVKPTSVNDLHSLKIKYFRSFAGLNDFINFQLMSCKLSDVWKIEDTTKLNVIDQDTIDFFKEE